MPDLFEACAEALCEGFRSGRSHAEQGAELKVPQRTIAAIVLGERQVGPKTFRAIADAKPPWFIKILLDMLGPDDAQTTRRN